MTPRNLFERCSAVVIGASILLGAKACHASVVVVSNRTERPISFHAAVDGLPPKAITLAAGDSRPLYGEQSAKLITSQHGQRSEIALDADCAYYFSTNAAGGLALNKIGLNDSPGTKWKPISPGAFQFPNANVITVKIVVDEDELRPRPLWERTIRERIAKASAVLEAHCGIRLQVVAVATWNSDNHQKDFNLAMQEFEREASPAPAQVAIGFSSQYEIVKGRFHMGATRGPLHSHIILKERSRNVLETERLELLVHELGHMLGASHSPEPTSVMRPVLTGALQRRAGASVQFDAPNTLLMALLAQEIRLRRIKQFSEITPETRRRMREIYSALEPTLPDDPAAAQYQQLASAARARSLVDDARAVLQHVVRIAKEQKTQNKQSATPIMGDRLLELYVRQAAIAAKRVKKENGPRAFVLALGVALDDSNALRNVPFAGSVTSHIEQGHEQPSRIAAIGNPTMRDRPDLAKHFFVSAHLVALAGSDAARSAGLIKEFVDARGDSGFSFADMAANRAGIVFANAVLTGRLTLDDVAQRFTVDAFLPPVHELREQLDATELTEAFGGVGDPRFDAQLKRIEARIQALPVYRAVQGVGR